MAENVVSLRFRVDNKGAIIGIESVGGAAEKTAEKIRLSNDAVRASNDKTQASHFSLFKSAEAGGLASGNAYMMGAVAIAAVADGMRKAVKSSMAWGRQTAVLNRSLQNAHVNHRGLANSIGDTTEKLSEKGGFAAPEQMQGMANFVTQTGSVNKAMKLNIATMNLARLTGKGYVTSQRLIATAEAGTPGRLARIVGPLTTVTKYTDGLTSKWKLAHPVLYQHLKDLNKQATATEIIAKVQAKAGGQMTTYSHTAAGAMSNMRNAVDNAGRQIGTVLLPYVSKAAIWLGKYLPIALRAAVTGFRTAVHWVANAVNWIQRLYNHSQMLQTMVRLTGRGFSQLGRTLGSVFEWIYNRGKWAFGQLKDDIMAAVGAIAAFVKTARDAYNFVEKFNPLATHVSGHGSNSQYQKLRQKAAGLGIHVPAQAPAGSIRSHAAHAQASALQGIGSQRLNANGQTGTALPSSSNGGDVVLHHKTVLGSRVVTEEVVRFSRRGNALSGAFASG